MPRISRHDGRRADELRPVRITPDYVGSAEGSCLIEAGRTRVICTASFVPGVEKWRAGKGLGWVTAEYGMLPASTGSRKPRPGAKPDGRGVEIQRLIGRVLRGVARYESIGENTFYLDCDVLEADGGTRTAAINGAYVSLVLAARKCEASGRCQAGVIRGRVAAISVGLVGGRELLDLDYQEDSSADVDLNLAMTGDGKFVEVQAAAEGAAFSDAQLRRMLALGQRSIRKVMAIQKQAMGSGT